MNEIEMALTDLKMQQERTQYMQVSRIFSNEIVLQFCGGDKSDCIQNDCESFMGTYNIHEDAKH